MILIVRMLKGVKTKKEVLQLEHVRVSRVQILPIADSTKSVMLKNASLTPMRPNNVRVWRQDEKS